MTNEEVIDVIKTERDYQDALTADPNSPNMVDLNLGSVLTAIRVNLEKAESSWYSNSSPHQEAMGYLRKISALSIKAGEQFGMPIRE